MTTKTAAYEYGALLAIKQAFAKHSEDTEGQEMNATQEKNPAESLAEVLKEIDIGLPTPGPDNKTKPEKDNKQTKTPAWGSPTPGTGGEALERVAPGFSLPSNGAAF